MEKKENKQEELQTRREFFKKAAKSMLPVLGAIALANVPLLSHAMEEGKTPMGCYGCSRSCYGICHSDCMGCYGSCKGGCRNSCYRVCADSCDNTCQGSCKNGCTRGNYF